MKQVYKKLARVFPAVFCVYLEKALCCLWSLAWMTADSIPFNSSPVLNCGHWSRSTQVVETSVIYNVYFKCQLQIKLNWFNLPNCYKGPFRNKSPGLSDLTSAALLTRTHISIIFLYRKDDQISLITNKKAKRTNYIRIQKKLLK